MPGAHCGRCVDGQREEPARKCADACRKYIQVRSHCVLCRHDRWADASYLICAPRSNIRGANDTDDRKMRAVEALHHHTLSSFQNWATNMHGMSRTEAYGRVEGEESDTYTLLFEALPFDCSSFDLIEDIPQPGGLVVRDIARNGKDVYRLGTD